MTSGEQPSYFSIGARAGAIPELDGFRGIAIILVLLRHAVAPTYEQHGALLPIGSWDIAVPFLNGWMGVDLFFVLSGFLIAHHLLNRWPERFSARFLLRYLARRVLRTFPAYYATLFVVAFGVLPFYQPEATEFWRQLAAHAFFMQDYAGSEFVPAFWSLGVEEKFYIVCPFLLLCLARYPRLRQVRILIGLALFPLLLRGVTVLGYRDLLETYPDLFWTVRAPFHLALDGLWIGVLCALIYRWSSTSLALRPKLANSLLAGGLVVVVGLFATVPWLDRVYVWPSVVILALLPIGFACVILPVITGATFPHRFLRSGWLRFFAVISYSVYLTHMTVVSLASRISAQLIGGVNSPLMTLAASIPVFLLLSIVGGLVLHFAVEKPFLVFKSRL
jgi:peptidoglycan/LPS O-acetylase OafA/YrhL